MIPCNQCNKKEATVFLTQIIEGKMQKMNFCETCAQKKGVHDPAGFALAELLSGLGLTQDTAPIQEISCTSCGFTRSQFKKTGRLGCGACYELFMDDLIPMLRNMHPSLAHLGKTPSRFEQEQKKKESAKILHEQLQKAIAAEEYEKAAQLRDEIATLHAVLDHPPLKAHSKNRGEQKFFPFEVSATEESH